ncbi:hypothetical protein A8924_4068 [Saccharopolyspora erythraea NRRL 2338]|uniref:Uncharacterized protein n=1 Tax=Saccharopolyspora erythraea (strain ATCC 11635 / DSM 40517 / JCM 4748 / NBRC 13426 / NCIMB 8594 / NRRL 2338) TaxID=405948 RepID=A4FFX7_SACEN|nr:hypothetical protein N599_22160 [Saccharopolyspora erythraea D]PFG96658.1 hypothetical protein A8924_4068 [Saccharopolyspora erythraea NRRL 2338]CAM02952.1 hypothetical protein SACE_3678 [Saccharopolyspora erythraea NRRL 2338]
MLTALLVEAAVTALVLLALLVTCAVLLDAHPPRRPRR